MSKTAGRFPRISCASVIALTQQRQRHVGWAAVGVTLTVVILGAGCGSGADQRVEPAPEVPVDTSTEAADLRFERGIEPPEMLCALAGPPSPSMGDSLVFSDEFDGSKLDPDKWNVATGYKGHDAIKNTSAPANVTVQDGLLRIRTERTASDPRYPYVSGYIDTLGKYARTYGKIEFRARFPRVAGVWYALWGRPWWESFPEIDVEVINRPSIAHTQVYFVNHWAAPPLPADERRSFVMLEKETDYSEFHTYSISWRPGHLEWLVDGVSKMEAKPQGVPTKPVYWIVNGWVGGWTGDPNDETPLPSSFELDYVRIYRVDGLIADPELKVVSPKPKYARSSSIRVVTANFDEACSHVELYDGSVLVRTTSHRPYRFALSRFSPGIHELSFVATDGVRRTTTKMTVEIL